MSFSECTITPMFRVTLYCHLSILMSYKLLKTCPQDIINKIYICTTLFHSWTPNPHHIPLTRFSEAHTESGGTVW